MDRDRVPASISSPSSPTDLITIAHIESSTYRIAPDGGVHEANLGSAGCRFLCLHPNYGWGVYRSCPAKYPAHRTEKRRTCRAKELLFHRELPIHYGRPTHARCTRRTRGNHYCSKRGHDFPALEKLRQTSAWGHRRSDRQAY